MADNTFVSDGSTPQYIDPVSAPTYIDQYVPPKVITLAETAEKKRQEYFNQLLSKKAQYDEAVISKRPTSGLELNPTEQQELSHWLRTTKEIEKTSRDYNTIKESVERNKENAWFDQSSLSGALANKALGFGTRAITDIGLGMVKAIPNIGSAALRMQISPIDLEYTRQLVNKEAAGEAYTPDEQNWINTNQDTYRKANQVFSNQRFVQAVDEVSKSINSVVNTLPTDIAMIQLQDSANEAVAYFKEGGIENIFLGIGSMLKGAGNLVTQDTNAAFQFLAETLPYTLFLMKAGAVGIPALAANIHEESMQGFTQEYGRAPTQGEQLVSMALSTLSAGLDKLGAEATLGGASAVKHVLNFANKTGVKTSKSAMNRLAATMVKGGHASPGYLNKATKLSARVGARVGEGFVVEGTTEASQNVLEQLATKQDISKVDPVSAIVEGQIGAVTGGMMTAPSVVQDYKKDKIEIIKDKFDNPPTSPEDYKNDYNIDPKKAGKEFNAAMDRKDVQAAIVGAHGLVGAALNNPDKVSLEYLKGVIKVVEDSDGVNVPDTVLQTLKDKVVELENESVRTVEQVAESVAAQQQAEVADYVSDIDQILEDGEVTTGNQQLVERILGSIDEKDPSASTVPVEQVKRLLDSNLFESRSKERNKLEAYVAANTKEVNDQLLRKGGGEGAGRDSLPTRFQNVSNAIKKNNKREAERSITSLVKLLNNQRFKVSSNGAFSELNTKGNAPKVRDNILEEIDVLEKGLQKAVRDFEFKFKAKPSIGKQIDPTPLETPSEAYSDNEVSEPVVPSPEIPKSGRKGTKTIPVQKGTQVADTGDGLIEVPDSPQANIEKQSPGTLNGPVDQKQDLPLPQVSTEKEIDDKVPLIVKKEVRTNPSTGKSFTLPEHKVYDKITRESGERLAESRLPNTISVTSPSVDKFFQYFTGNIDGETSEQKSKVLELIAKQGYTLERLRKLLNTERKVKEFLILHEQSHLTARDHKGYGSKTAEEKLTIETRATINALNTLAEFYTKKSTSEDTEVAQGPIVLENTPVTWTGTASDLKRAIDKAYKAGWKTEIQLLYDNLRKIDKKDYLLPNIEEGSGKVLTESQQNLRNSVINEFAKVIEVSNKESSNWLKNRIFGTPIKRKGGNVSYAPEGLYKVVKPKQGKPNNIFQLVPNLFGKFVPFLQGKQKELPSSIANAVDTDLTKLGTAQREVLNTLSSQFIKLYKFWNTDKRLKYSAEGHYYATDIVIKQGENYLVKDTTPLFLQQKDAKSTPQLDSNVIGIIATVVTEWIGTRSKDTLFNNDEALRGIFGLSNDDDIAPQHRSVTFTGIQRSLLVRDLGNKIFNMLELESTSDTYAYLIPHMKVALGQLAVTYMKETGMLTEEQVDIDGIKQGVEVGEPAVDSGSTVPFIKIRTATSDPASQQLYPEFDILASNMVKDASKILNAVFGVESFHKFPQFTRPGDKKRFKIKGALEWTSEYTTKALNKLARMPWKPIAAMKGIVQESLGDNGFLNREDLLDIAGRVDTSEMHSVHKNNTDAKNAGLSRSLDFLQEFFQRSVDAGKEVFYLKPVAWTMGRFGYESNTINPGTDKIHRSVVGLEASEVTFMLENTEDREQFIRGLAQSFGLKPEKDDKTWINKFNVYLRDPRVIKAIAAIQNKDNIEAIKEIAGDNYKQTIKELIGEFEEAFHSLHGLVELAAVTDQVTKDTVKLTIRKQGEYTTYLAREIDGKTNGAALTLLQIGFGIGQVAFEKLLNACGIYFTKGYTAKQHFSNPSNLDLYQYVGTTADAFLREYRNTEIKPNKDISPNKAKYLNVVRTRIFDTLWKYTKEDPLYSPGTDKINDSDSSIFSRNFTKGPTTQFFFGQGRASAARALSNSFMMNILEEMATFHPESSTQRSDIEWKAFKKDLEILFFKSEGVSNLTRENTRDFLFTDEEYKSFTNAVQLSIGEALYKSFEALFPSVITYRETLSMIADMMHFIYMQAYDAKIDGLKRAGKPITPAQKDAIKQELQHLRPTYPGPRSDGPDSYIDTLSTNTGSDPAFVNQQVYSVPLSNGAKSTSDHIEETRESAPGIKPLIGGIHHSDASAQQAVMLQQPILDLHDATWASVFTSDERGYLANKDISEISQQYSILEGLLNKWEEVQQTPEYAMFSSDLQKHVERTRRVYGSIERDARHIQVITEHAKYILDLSLNAKKELYDRIQVFDNYIGENTAYVANKDTKDTKAEEVIAELRKAIMDVSIDGISDEGYYSIGNGINPKTFVSMFDRTVDPFTMETVFDELVALGPVVDSDSHRIELKRVLNNIVHKIFDPGSKLLLKVGSGKGQTAGYIYPNNKIFIKTGTSAVSSFNSLSAQATFVHEMIHAISHATLRTDMRMRRNVEKLFEHAKQHLTADMLLSYTVDEDGNKVLQYKISPARERAEAQKMLDYIFNSENALDEFLAHGTTNERFREALKQIPPLTKGEVKGFLQTLISLVNRLLTMFSDRVHRYENKPVDEALEQVLLDINYFKDRNVNMILQNKTKLTQIDEKAVQLAQEYILTPLTNLFNAPSSPFSGSKFKSVRNIVETMQEIDTVPFDLAVSNVRRRLGEVENGVLKQLHSWFMGDESIITKTLREINEPYNQANFKWHTMLRKAKQILDQLRQSTSEYTEKYIKHGFISKFTEEHSKSLNMTLLRADLQSVFSKYSITNIAAMLKSDTELRKELKRIRKDIMSTYPEAYGRYIINHANGLGYFMATGKDAIGDLMLNSSLIVDQAGVPGSSKIKVKDLDREGLIQQIDILASLYAVAYTEQHHRTVSANKILEEYGRNPTKNGITRIIDRIQSIKKDSLDKLFNNPYLMMKNYSKDATNPYVDIRVAPTNMEEDMKNEGYIILGEAPLQTDANGMNLDQKFSLYITRDGFVNERVRSIVSITSKQKAGTSYSELLEALGYQSRAFGVQLSKYLAKNQEEIAKQQKQVFGDLRKVKDTFMVPLRNESGNIIDLRYTADHDTRDNLLERELRIEKVLGQTESSITDKVSTEEINSDVVDGIYAEFAQYYPRSPISFVEISADSPDGKKYREIYKLLPEDMKRRANTLFGEDKLIVRASIVDLVFGFRKASVLNAELFGREIGKDLNSVMLAINDVIGGMFPKLKYKGSFPLKALEMQFQEAFKIVKDLIVVKSGAVLVGNFLSNTLILMVKGVPAKQAISLQLEGYKHVSRYQKHKAEMGELERELADESARNTKARIKTIKGRIANLQRNLEVNPIHDLVEEGMFQAIIEDLELEDTPYGSAAKLSQKIEDWVDSHNVPNWSKAAGQYLWFGKETPMYKFLFRATQYGDFVSRYALYEMRRQQELTRKGMSNAEKAAKREEIIRECSRTFINYDIPTSPEMQWVNDMGIFPFTKFFFRIQRVIFEMFRTKPVSSLMVSMLKSFLAAHGMDVSWITDSAELSTLSYRVNDPVSSVVGGIGLPATSFNIGILK